MSERGDDSAGYRVPVQGTGFSKLQRCSYLEDRISYLPDEILVSLLSRLETEEAVRTGVLGRRWRYLWRHTTSLAFEFEDRDDFLYDLNLCKVECHKFVHRVSHILETHLAATIDDFTIRMSLIDPERYSNDIDSWLSLAFQKKVKRLSINLACPLAYIGGKYIVRAPVMGIVDSLTCLHLSNVYVTGEFLERLLTIYCPCLEELVLHDCSGLVKFTVSGPSLKLKVLKIRCCDLTHLCIQNVNLASLFYGGVEQTLIIRETPNLVKAHFLIFNDLKNVTQNMAHLSQLETLTLKYDCFKMKKVMKFPKFSKLINLKHLELVLSADIFCGRFCALLLKAFPFLNELKVEFKYLEESDKERKTRNLKHPHKHLKVVELSGFIASELDLGFALYVINNTTSLKKMIVDLHKKQAKISRATSLVGERLQTSLAPGTQIVFK